MAHAYSSWHACAYILKIEFLCAHTTTPLRYLDSLYFLSMSEQAEAERAEKLKASPFGAAKPREQTLASRTGKDQHAETMLS